MHDQISRYRTVRVALHVPTAGSGQAHWTVTAVDTRKGVPHASLVAQGRVSLPGGTPGVADITAALSDVVGALSGQ